MTRSPGDFELVGPPVLSRGVVNREEPLRLDTERQRRTWDRARLVVVDENGRTPVTWETDPRATFREGDAAGWGSVSTGTGARVRTGADVVCSSFAPEPKSVVTAVSHFRLGLLSVAMARPGAFVWSGPNT